MTSKPQYSSLTPSQGGRSASWVGFGYNGRPSLASRHEVVRLQAEDGGESEGHLFTRGGEKTVVCFMHPKGDFTTHYCMRGLSEAGYAVFGQRSRYVNHDTACIHEILIADVAASIQFLRSKDFENIVLVGNSGGGSLYTFYQAQAQTAVGNRISNTPAGDPYDLNLLDLPKADAVVMLAAHPGEGKALMLVIDPSVIDESDPLSVDDSIDMFHPKNGFQALPAQSNYTADFIERYRKGQRARVARLDAMAREQIRAMREARALMSSPSYTELPIDIQRGIERRATASKFLTIYRTDANPANCDLSIDPSPRKTGSLLGPRPDLQNYQMGGVASTLTPEAWLSTWSGLSSHGSVLDNLQSITVPFFIIYFNADPIVFPEEVAEMLVASASADKSMVEVDADHYGMDASGSIAPRGIATGELIRWLEDRFPAAGHLA